MLIGLSYHGGDSDYDAYALALQRRAQWLGIELQAEWLAGAGRPERLHLLETLDGVVLTGGADVEPHRYGFADTDGICKTRPERDAVEWRLLGRLTAKPLPTLAICRRAQLLNVFAGGSLIPDLGERNPVHKRGDDYTRQAHEVTISPGTLLHRVAGGALQAPVNSSHHQAVARLARDFRTSGMSPDGVIEAFERADPRGRPFLLAVQWHPEAMQAGLLLGDGPLDAFLTSARLH